MRGLLAKYGGRIEFFAPVAVFDEAREHLPSVVQSDIPVEPVMACLDALSTVIKSVDLETYASFEAVARQRPARRDEDDWPVLAAALALACPVGRKIRTSLALACGLDYGPGGALSHGGGIRQFCF